jgi:hypothetical protein
VLRALGRLGRAVTVASGPDLAPRVRQEGFAHASILSVDGETAAIARATREMADSGETWRFTAEIMGGVVAPRWLPQLRALADLLQPEIVVHPPVDLAAPLLAAERGLTSVCCGYSHPFEPRVLGAMADRVAPLWLAAGLDPDPHAGLYRDHYLDPVPPSLRAVRGPDGAGPPAGVALEIRPEVPGQADDPLPAWGARLGRRPLVYVSLGTNTAFNHPRRLSRLLARLAGPELECVVTTGRQRTADALGELPATIHVERWLSLASVLPRCDAALCHGGNGTTLAVLASGLPMVLAPQGADQFTNAAALAASGAARTLLPAAAAPDAIRDAVLEVVRPNGSERRHARRLAQEIASMPTADDVARQIDLSHCRI